MIIQDNIESTTRQKEEQYGQFCVVAQSCTLKSCLVWLFDSVWDIQVLLTTSQATTFSFASIEAIFAPGAAHVCIIKLTELLGLQCHETLTVKQHTHVDLSVPSGNQSHPWHPILPSPNLPIHTHSTECYIQGHSGFYCFLLQHPPLQPAIHYLNINLPKAS